MRNPRLMQELMRHADTAMQNIEMMPGGAAHLARFYNEVQEPLLEGAVEQARMATSAATATTSETQTQSVFILFSYVYALHSVFAQANLLSLAQAHCETHGPQTLRGPQTHLPPFLANHPLTPRLPTRLLRYWATQAPTPWATWGRPCR